MFSVSQLTLNVKRCFLFFRFSFFGNRKCALKIILNATVIHEKSDIENLEFYSYRNASIGFFLAALLAGKIPKTKPITEETTIPRMAPFIGKTYVHTMVEK